MSDLNKNTVFLSILLSSVIGCSNTKIDKNNSVAIENWIEKKAPLCKVIINSNNKMLTHKEVIECIDDLTFKLSQSNRAPKNLFKYLGYKLVSKEASIPKGTLTKVVEKVAQGYSGYSEFISFLISKGASTKDISLQLVLDGNSVNCQSTLAILKNNKNIYSDSSSTKEINGYRVSQDLTFLADTGDGRKVCPKAIKYLAKLNPKLRNIKQRSLGFTPLHFLFTDFDNTGNTPRNRSLAKILMTKKNINMSSNAGDTPLHVLFLYGSPKKEDLPIIKQIINLGANLNIRNKKGVSVKELIIKNPEFRSLLPMNTNKA